MTYKFGDIVLADFPYTDLSGSKRRPSVVVSSAEFNRGRPDVLVVQVSANNRDGFWGEFQVDNWQESGLRAPSRIKPVIATIETDTIVRSLGVLDSRSQELLRPALPTWFG